MQRLLYALVYAHMRCNTHESSMKAQRVMILLQLHLKEIQYRCMYIALAYLFSCVYAFETADIYLYTLLHYVGVGETQCTYIGEAFNVSLVIAMMIAFIFTLPYGVYMVHAYTRPGKRSTPWYDERIRDVKHMRALSKLCVAVGAVVCILKSVPLVIQYFLSYADGLQIGLIHDVSHVYPYEKHPYHIHTQPRLSSTVYFTLRILLTLVCIVTCFWLIMWYNQDRLAHIHRSRYAFRPYAYVFILLFASIIAPPEGYVQICITFILCFMLEMSIFIAMYTDEYA